MSVIDGCEWSAWGVLAKKPPVEQKAEVNPESVWTQKQYWSSNPDSPVILVTIPIYRLKRKLRGEGRPLQLLRPKRKRSELRDVCCLRSDNWKLCANVRAEMEVWCTYGSLMEYDTTWVETCLSYHFQCWCLSVYQSIPQLHDLR